MRRTTASLLTFAFAMLCLAPAASAQTTFFQMFNGRINSSETVSVRNGDRVVVRLAGGGGNFTAVVDSAGEFNGLTITRESNEEVDMTFELRKGSTVYALVPSPGATDQIKLQFNGFNNPLSAAFNAQTITAFVGPRLSGGTGDPNDPNAPRGDPADVNGDGRITKEDARIVMSYIIGRRDNVSDASLLDVNGDGRITTDDVVEILRRVGEVVETPDDGGDGGEAASGAGGGAA